MKLKLFLFFLACFSLNTNAQLLWKITGKELKAPSYLMGTHHLAPLSIMDSIKGMQTALNSTTQVIGELNKNEKEKIDDRCSLHVHVEVADCSMREISSILSWWIKCEGVFIDSVPANRKRNRFCESIGVSDMFEANFYESSALFSTLASNKYLSLNTYHINKKN